MVMVEETYLPVTLYAPGLTDARFQEFCEQYTGYRLEYTADGELLIMSPTAPETSFRNARITTQLMNWRWHPAKGLSPNRAGGSSFPTVRVYRRMRRGFRLRSVGGDTRFPNL